MAQSQQTHENVRNIHEASEADIKAWCEAASARKYRVHENMPYSYGSGMIFPLPAPVGFAALNAGVRPLVFQAVAQFVTNRIGQTQDGNVSAKIAAALATGEGLPGAQSNDAFDSAYYDHIAALVEAKLGPYNKGEDDKELTGEALKAAKAKRDATIETNASHAPTRDKHFANSVKEAIERGQNKPTSGRAKRASKPTDTSALMDL